MNFNIIIPNNYSLSIVYPNYYIYLNKFINTISPSNPIDEISKNIDFITRNNKDNRNYILCTLNRADIILYIKDNKLITGIALLNLDFNNELYICGMYTSETNDKKYGSYLMDMIKNLCKNIDVNKISLSPIDDNVKQFYIKNKFYLGQDNLLYYDI